eukprot:TRINITY_DN11999_c0_g1_i10.p1 TRINITY_DN11999_c0_g1~~TRINITY_DN11999_c0_g1_i10.p1  ORF type:complete len:237 (+),score=4.62 TRINITY_DN11999_c0_g1_i10:241-951(+)
MQCTIAHADSLTRSVERHGDTPAVYISWYALIGWPRTVRRCVERHGDTPAVYISWYALIGWRFPFEEVQVASTRRTTSARSQYCDHISFTGISSDCQPVRVHTDDDKDKPVPIPADYDPWSGYPHDDDDILIIYGPPGAIPLLFAVLAVLVIRRRKQRQQRQLLVNEDDDRHELVETSNGDSGEVEAGYGAQLQPQLTSNHKAAPTPAAPLEVMPRSTGESSRVEQPRGNIVSMLK